MPMRFGGRRSRATAADAHGGGVAGWQGDANGNRQPRLPPPARKNMPFRTITVTRVGPVLPTAGHAAAAEVQVTVIEQVNFNLMGGNQHATRRG